MKKLFKEHDLAKFVLAMLILVVVLTWIIPNGSFGTGAEFTKGTIQRIGLVHIFYGITYALQNFSIQVIFILFVGIFYGVVSKTDGYIKLVEKIAKLGKGKEVVFALVVAFITALLTSVITTSYVMLMFMPFLMHILRKMNFSKLGAFASTIGAMLVGVLGATYGTEGALSLITYLGYGGSDVTIQTELLVRFGILLLAFIIYAFILVNYLKKNAKKDKKDESKEDILTLGEVKNKKAKVWPIASVLIIAFILAILGFVDWSANFKLEIFNDFHEWFMNLAIGDFKIFNAIAGENLETLGYNLATAFGTWYLFTYTVVIAIVTLFIGLFSNMKFDEFLTNVGNGFKSVVKPLALMTLAYTVFVFLYWSPIVPTIVNALGTAFNPFIATLQAFIGSIFNTDLGYLGYSLSYFIGSFTGKEGNVIYLIYTTIYGLVMFVTPISMFLIFGLSYLDIPYKKWLSYIWKFVVAMLVILLLIFALLTYL